MGMSQSDRYKFCRTKRSEENHTMKELLADTFYVQLEGIRKGFPIRGVATVEVIAGIRTKIYCNCSCFFLYNLSALYTVNSHFCGHRKDHE